MSNKVQKYVNNRLCCLASNIVKHDKEIKYSSDKTNCLISNDFIASVFLKLLSCSPFPNDLKYYSMEITLEWFHESPPEVNFPGYFTMTSDIQITSYNGNRILNIPVAGIYYADSLKDANIILNDIINEGFNIPEDMSSTVMLDPLTGKATYNLIYSESWGNPSQVLNGAQLNNTTYPLDSQFSIVLSDEELTNTTIGCFTSSQMCDIKAWLDNYCRTCGSNYTSLPTSI